MDDELQKMKTELAIMKAIAMKPLFDAHISVCVPAIIVDSDTGEIIYSTPPVNNLFGYAGDEMIGQRLEMLMPERFRETHSSHFQKFILHPVRRSMGERDMHLFGITKEGKEFGIEIGLHPTSIVDKKCIVATILPLRK